MYTVMNSLLASDVENVAFRRLVSAHVTGSGSFTTSNAAETRIERADDSFIIYNAVMHGEPIDMTRCIRTI